MDNVRPYAENVGAKAGPLVGQAAERVGPVVENAGQRLSGAVSNAADVSEPYRREAALRSRAAWAALCGGDPSQVLRRSRRNRRWMVVGGLAALAIGAAVAYGMVRTAPPSTWHPNAGDPLAPDAGGTESGEEPSSEGTGEAAGSRSNRSSEDARPNPPHQRTSSDSTSNA